MLGPLPVAARPGRVPILACATAWLPRVCLAYGVDVDGVVGFHRGAMRRDKRLDALQCRFGAGGGGQAPPCCRAWRTRIARWSALVLSLSRFNSLGAGCSHWFYRHWRARRVEYSSNAGRIGHLLSQRCPTTRSSRVVVAHGGLLYRWMCCHASAPPLDVKDSSRCATGRSCWRYEAAV